MYPDLTADELSTVTDTTCIICREDMQAQSIKRLSCQHIFHKNCLRSWFQRQQTCMHTFTICSLNGHTDLNVSGPICRTTVLRPNMPRATPNTPAAAAAQQQQPPHQHQPQAQGPDAQGT